MIMSASTTIEMSSIDCWISPGGPDSRSGLGHHEQEGTAADTYAPSGDGAETRTGEGGRASEADGGRDRSLSAPEVPASSVAGTEASCVRVAPAGWPHHDWFEGRGSGCVLMASIDDALSRVFARFDAVWRVRSRRWTAWGATCGSKGFPSPSVRTSIRPTSR